MYIKTTLVILSLLSSLAARSASAQDTTQAKVKTGWRLAMEVPLSTNNSLRAIQNKLTQTNINADGVGDTFGNFVLSFVREDRKNTTETRVIGMLTSEGGPVVAQPVRRSRMYGFGIGLSNTFKIIQTQRFIVGPTLGYDVMWYRLALLPVQRDNVPIASVANDPGTYAVNTLRQGFYLNLHGGVGAELRLYWFKKSYDEIRLGGRVGYQFPLLRSSQWELNDGTVSDLPGFQARLLYYQFGLTFISKRK